MPLKSGKTQRIISENISEMMHSSTFAKDKPKHKRQEMAVAAAMDKARKKKRKKA
jgi:hypothetical protein